MTLRNMVKMPVRTRSHGCSSKQIGIVAAFFALLVVVALPVMAQEQGQYTPPPPPPPPGAPQQQPPEMQQEQGPPPTMSPSQLDQLVSSIALYPDPLLAQVLTASTFGDQIPDAANWANQHSGLRGDELANAIREDNLQWDPSVLALLPFPSVLNMMASDTNWTNQLGDAVLAQRNDVMDAVQRMRDESYRYGYLRSNPYDNVVYAPGDIEIQPVNPAYLYVPVYSPGIVFAAPRPGFFIGGAIHFGPAIVIGAPFLPLVGHTRISAGVTMQSSSIGRRGCETGAIEGFTLILTRTRMSAGRDRASNGTS